MSHNRCKTLRIVEIIAFCLVLAGFLAGPAAAQLDPDDDPNEYDNPDVFTTPVISEFMASNGSKQPLAAGGLLDEDGDSSDWIEIYNPTGQTVHLGGWYLTDNADNLEQWQFPAGVALNPGQFLVVFASGKDRASAMAELHTNFQLDAEGEYLALVESDGVTIAHEYSPKFPKQLTDVSYGLGQYATELIPQGVRASYHVPTAGDEGKDWTALDFDDSAWNSGPTGIGFGTSAQGFQVIYYKANTTVGDLDTAELVISNPSYQSAVASETAPVINYFNTGSEGHYDNNNPFPSTTIGGDVEDFVVLVTGRILIPLSGDWSFGVNSDDGFGVEMTNGSSVLTFSYPSPRSPSDTIVTFNIPNGGFYDVRLVFYERGGGSGLEFFAAQGRYRTFDAARFRLVGNVAGGGLYVMSSSDEANTNIEQQMKNVNASLWTRIEFEADQVDFFDSLALRMKYEDAFVAYLNGVEIARGNFTGTPAWNSAADGDRPNELASEFMQFGLSDLLDDLREGTNVLAIHGLNDGAAGEEFLILPELIAASNRMMPQYFTTATPGQFNVSGAMNIVADTKFSVDRGFYDLPFDVAITCDTPGATIHYTLDGSAPSDTYGYEYTGPIRISTTTCLRAMAFRPGWMSTNVDTQTYIFLDQVAHQPSNPFGFPGTWGSTTADYEMDPEVINDSLYRGRIRESLLSLPTMSIVTETDNLFGARGIYSNSLSAGVAWERPASVEYFFPDGATGFQVNAGLRIYGGDPFRGMNLTRKKSFRLLFKRQYGPTKLNYPLFDAPDAATSFDTIVLRAGSNDGWNNWGGTNSQYIIDEFMHLFQLDLGQVSPHGTFMHLYVNGLYWGLYHATERPMASFCASYYGGDKEEWDALNSGTPTGESNTTTWNAMLNQASSGLADNESYQKIQGNNPDGTKNPAYNNLLDIENYIDWLFTNFWGGTGDWPNHNFFAGCRRPPNATGFKFINWDSEGAIIVWSDLNANVTGVSSNGARPYVTLRDNDEFRMLFADHTYRHMFNNGPATSEASYARYKKLADQVEPAMIAESARWGDQARSRPYTLADWKASRDYILGTYMPRRPAIVLNQLRSAGLYPSIEPPAFYVNGQPQHGGQIPTIHVLSMTAATGKVYYTTDGNDPRLPTILDIINDETLVAENASKRVLVPTGSINENWKGSGTFNDSAWTACIGSPGGVGYETGSGYQSYISLDLETRMYNGNNSCYIRIPFTIDSGRAAGFNFMRLWVRYDDGFVAYLNGTEVARRNFTGTPAWNSNADSAHDDSAAVNLEMIDISAYTNRLKGGDNILAIHGMNNSQTSTDLLISVQLTAGESRTVGEFLSDSATEYTGPIQLTESTRIKARLRNGTTWSALNDVIFAVGPVAENLRITEIMFNPQDTGSPDDPNREFIELKNIGTERLNLNLVRFTNGVDFIFPSLELEAGQYVLVVKDVDAFSALYGDGLNIAGEYTGSLNNAGERIELQDAAGQSVMNFQYSDGWYDITDGTGFSLTVEDPTAADPNQWNDKSAWRPSAAAGGSPGWDDAGQIPALGEVVINELLAHSHAGEPDWIELHNTSDETIDIGGWFLSDSPADFMQYEIAAGTTIEPDGYIVFYEDLHFGNPDDPGCHVPFALSENGETLYLHSGTDGVLTGYSDQEKFDASETGVAFGRYQKSTDTYNFVAMSENTPGSTNAYPKVGPVVINEIMYNPASGDQNAEYIELLNISDSAVILAEYDNEQMMEVPWRFADDGGGIVFDFPLGTTMAPGEYLLLVRDKDVFESGYTGAADNVQIFEWGSGRLNNAGEKVQLSKPGDQVDDVRYYIRVDRVNYSDGSHLAGEDPWPAGPDGYGKSLTRKVPTDYGNDPENWTAADPSPGRYDNLRLRSPFDFAHPSTSLTLRLRSPFDFAQGEATVRCAARCTRVRLFILLRSARPSRLDFHVPVVLHRKAVFYYGCILVNSVRRQFKVPAQNAFFPRRAKILAAGA